MNNIDRRKFLASAAGLGMAGLASTGFNHSRIIQNKSDQSGRKITSKGKMNSGVAHWDIITIGNLSRNRYWGESDEKALHSVICTCSVITIGKTHIIVDPSLTDEAAMATELKRRTGLSPSDIDTVFITHQHGDHVAGLKHFLKARWLAGSEVASGLNKSALYPKQVEPAGKTLFEIIDVIPAPGHTPDLQILRFDFTGLSVVVAGDSVATKDFWDERRAYYNVMDPEESKRSMEKIDSIADVIVPGHDNYFLNLKSV